MNTVDSAISSVIAAKESAVRTQVAFAVEAKRLEAMRSQGDAATQLIDACAQLSKEIGKGMNFDALA